MTALAWSACALAQNGVDEAGVRAAIAQQEAAFNAHDAAAFAGSYAGNADIVIPFGWRWRGRAQIAAKYGEAFTYVLAQSRIHADTIELTPLAPGLVLAHIGWTATGMRTPDGANGSGTEHGIESQILSAVAGRWLVVSSQETLVTPEQPLAVQAKPAPPVRKCLLANRKGDCLIYK